MWKALNTLGPIAFGHLVSVALVAGAAVLGMSMNQGLMLGGVAVALGMLGVGCLHRHRTRGHGPPRAGPARLASLGLGSFLVTTLHGAGLALVPALVPLCLALGPSHPGLATGPIAEALWRVGAACTLHTVAMLVASRLLGAVIRHVVAAVRLRGQVRLSPSTAPTFHPP